MHVRMARFEGIDRSRVDEDAEQFKQMVHMQERPDLIPEDAWNTLRDGVKRVLSLVDREAGVSVDLTFTDSAEDARRVHEVLDAMSPPEGAGKRTSFQIFEVLVDEQPG